MSGYGGYGGGMGMKANMPAQLGEPAGSYGYNGPMPSLPSGMRPGGGMGNFNGPVTNGLVYGAPPRMSEEFQQAGSFGPGMAANGVMPAGNTGYRNMLPTPYELRQAGLGQLLQSSYQGLPSANNSPMAIAQRQQNHGYAQRGQGMAANSPDAYAALQARVAANHPGWNQNRIDNRAAFRLGKRGV